MIVRKWLIEQSVGTGLEKLEIVDNLPITGRGVKTTEIIENDGVICSIPMEAILTGNGVFTTFIYMAENLSPCKISSGYFIQSLLTSFDF